MPGPNGPIDGEIPRSVVVIDGPTEVVQQETTVLDDLVVLSGPGDVDELLHGSQQFVSGTEGLEAHPMGKSCVGRQYDRKNSRKRID